MTFDSYMNRVGVAEVTPTQRRIWRKVALGAPQKEVAAELGVCVQTVNKHVGELHRKLGVHHITQLTLAAVRHGIVDPVKDSTATNDQSMETTGNTMIPPGKTVIGTCSLCRGPVCVHSAWMATIPDTPTCARCGAVKEESYGPVIKMWPPGMQQWRLTTTTDRIDCANAGSMSQ